MSIARHLTLGQSLQQLVLSFHPTLWFLEKAMPCGHRLQALEESGRAGKLVHRAVSLSGRVDPGIPVPQLVGRFLRAYAGLIVQELRQVREEFPKPFSRCSLDRRAD